VQNVRLCLSRRLAPNRISRISFAIIIVAWSPSLRSKDQEVTDSKREVLEKQWRNYVQRPGLRTAFDMLIGLSKKHEPTQSYLARFETSNADSSFLRACHWIEATSDNTSARISMNGLGLLAETLLDELSENNDAVAKQVMTVRRKTRDRKKEIALARRSKALGSMSSFGPLAGATSLEASAKEGVNRSGSVRETAASILAPVLGLFRDSNPSNPSSSLASSSAPAAKRRKTKTPDKPPAKPAWMAEMESMEDETGLTCAVCQEGRTLQPSELLGLYAYVKKVSIPVNQCGGRTNIDGTVLLTSLPSSLPDSLIDSHAAVEWYPIGRSAGEELRESSRGSNTPSSVASNRRATYFTTTVSAGNAIHFSCHSKARTADRNHPKAPKSEWEGASLRNSRVNCNVMMPLVSSRSSKVTLVAVDVALTDHQTAISNLLGARPKSMLWTAIHDVRLLLLRMAYGESLNTDCGGGSFVSNAKLLFYQLLMADMFEKDAQVDAPETSQHARGLSAGFLAACSIVKADDFNRDSSSASLLRGIADAAPMAALTCILFHNTKDDFSSEETSDDDQDVPHPKRRWVFGKESFLRGLIRCAGRRHALGIENSGCITARNNNNRNRSGSFAEWEMVEDDVPESSSSASRKSVKRSLKPDINDFRDALRPMITYYAIMDQLSTEFVPNMDDCKLEQCSNHLVQAIEGCQRSKGIHELLRKAKVTLDHDDIIEELQKGMCLA
jgi:hypothetical protein